MKNPVIVLGGAHYNTIGMVQCLGGEGLYVIAVIVGRSGLLSESVYAKEIHEVVNYDSAIRFIANELCGETRRVIIPCGDEAALKLEQNYNLLKDQFTFQRTVNCYTIAKAMDKNFQATIAKECGIAVPRSCEIQSVSQIPKDIQFPCIIKPLLSCEGDKRDISVARNDQELHQQLEHILRQTPRVILQQYIEDKEKELNILGCSYSNGELEIPLSIEKLRIHPPRTGSVSVGLIKPLDDKIKEQIPLMKRMIQEIGYIGLFSFEFAVDRKTESVFFIELNLRNDALNPFVVKAGVNLPYLHYLDLSGLPLKSYTPIAKARKMICEPVHMASIYRGSISFWAWIKDLLTSSSFMLYYKKDKKLFFMQFLEKLRRR